MCPDDTSGVWRPVNPSKGFTWLVLAILAGAANLAAQRPDWRRIGNAAVDAALASVATGPVERVWYAGGGSRLGVKTRSGRTYETADFEAWQIVTGGEPGAIARSIPDGRPPEPGARVVAPAGSPARRYAVGLHAWRSDDGGLNWTNLTAWRGTSILGGGLNDLAVSPADPDDIVVAGDFGVWRSLDGGLSWNGLNQSLPNLPARRLLAVPSGTRGVRLLVAGMGAPVAVEWAPGEKTGWRAIPQDDTLATEGQLRADLSRAFTAAILSVSRAGSYTYAGAADGRIWASADEGRSWRPWRVADGGAVASFYVDPREPSVALAALAGPGTRVLRTLNGGLFWDDITANLPDGVAHAVAADRSSGAVYAATDRGLYFTFADLLNPGPATTWTLLSADLPAAAVTDVRLDSAANQLYVALDGYGVYAATAPHRGRDPRVVSAADWSQRAAAPGALLSVLGRRVRAARSGDRNVPVLASSEGESQIQVPFDAQGGVLSLALEGAPTALAERWNLSLPLDSVSPALFVDRDGTPLVLDADSGVLLDAMTPARSGTRVQILATGLGRVRPDWPTGLAAPLNDPPRVTAPVRVFLDRTPLEVTRAILAPGYIGFYLIEFQAPQLVNVGPAELYVEADGRQSNRVRIYLEP